jgi:hypothetical protein
VEDKGEGQPSSIDELYREWAADTRAKGEELQKCGRQIWRAMRQWNNVTTQEDWDQVVSQAKEDLDNGQFLINRLGGQLYLEPEVIAILLILRKGFIDMYGIKTPAEYMLVDMTLIAYYNGLRAQRMLGDLATSIEHEFFGIDGPRVKLKEKDGYVADGFQVEDMLERAREQLQGMLERANRILIRNLRALRELQGGNLVIRADQVNIAQQQFNQQAVK